ncbi:MAG: hypothetical protein ACT4OS_02850 [Acidimicrobiales bacterium]
MSRESASAGGNTATMDSSAAGDHSSAGPPVMCEVCGLDVDPAEVIRAEMAVAGAMCPSPMAFHPPCFEAAKVMWEPDPDSYCLRDDRFPETMQWDVVPSGSDSEPQAELSIAEGVPAAGNLLTGSSPAPDPA